jgi:hypothetical protein
MEFLDVEVITTILEFTATPSYSRRAISLLQFRLVCKRWRTAVATGLERWIEETHHRNLGTDEEAKSSGTDEKEEEEEPIYGKTLWDGMCWYCYNKSEFRAVYVSAADFCQTFFEVLTGVCIPKCTDWELKWILDTCPNLEKLEVEATEVHEPSLRVLESIGEKCPKLKMLGCGYESRLEEKEVKAILSHVSGLEIIQLRRPRLCTDAFFSFLLSKGYQLTCLDIAGFPLKRQSSLIAFLESQTTLERADLPNIRRLGDRCLATIGRCSANLTDLDVSWCPRVTRVGMLAVTKNCTKLKRLRAMGVGEVGERTLCELGTHCPELFVLSIYRENLTAEALIGIAECTKMRSLDLYRTPTAAEVQVWTTLSRLQRLQQLSVTDAQVSDSGFASLADGCGATLTTCYFRELTGYSERGMATFVERCPKLTTVVITGDVLGDEFLDSLSRLPKREFGSLDFSSQQRMTSDGLQLFLRSQPARKLHSFSCDRVAAVDDAVLRSIAEAECGSSMTSLSVGHSSVTDAGLIFALGRCRNLSTLDVSVEKYNSQPNSGKVTDKFVDFLVARKTEMSLSYFNFYGCTEVSVTALRRLLKAYPEMLISSDYSDAELEIRKNTSRPTPPPSPRDEDSGSEPEFGGPKRVTTAPLPLPQPPPPPAAPSSEPDLPPPSSSDPPPPKKKRSCELM